MLNLLKIIVTLKSIYFLVSLGLVEVRPVYCPCGYVLTLLTLGFVVLIIDFLSDFKTIFTDPLL
jgi:hypothetical protein